MSMGQKIAALIVLILLLVLCISLGSRYTGYESQTRLPENEKEANEKFSYIALTDADRNDSVSGTKEIDLGTASDPLEISSGGSYVLSGNYEGTIVVNAKDEIVRLILSGASVKSNSGSAINVVDAAKVIITSAEGTENSLTDSGHYDAKEDPDATVYSVCDLTFNGTGSLEIHGLYDDAVHCKDVLRVADGRYRVFCKRSALRGNDGVHIDGGTIFLESERYGVRTTKSGENGRGDILISGGTVSIVAGRYALAADRGGMYAYDCSLQMNSVISDYDVKGVTVIADGCVK